MIRSRGTVAGLLSWAVLCSGVATAIAQVPDRFTNLEVLPEDIPKEELLERMRSFSFDLGVLCVHCHVGDEGGSLEGMDFASDAKPTKRTARVMLRMVDEINGKHLAGVVSERSTRLEVTCATCHHRIPYPEPIEDIVARTIVENGVDAGLVRYRELRDRHYGSGAYDFSVVPLARLSERLTEESELDAAVAVLAMAVELNPDSSWARLLLGGAYRKRGDTRAAIAAYRKALKLNPKSTWARKALSELTGSD